MPLANYCRKCKAEVSTGEACPYCGGKLTKTGERLSFGVVRSPVRDWFAWNRMLRVGLPALLTAFVVTVLYEALANGERGVEALFRQGFVETMLGLLAGLLLLCLLLLWLQGDERVHYWMDKDGVSAYVYLQEPSRVQLYARFLSPESVEALAANEHTLEGLTLVRRVVVPWEALRRVRIWRETPTILFYRPKYWQVLAMRCPVQELDEAEAYLRAKLKRFGRVLGT